MRSIGVAHLPTLLLHDVMWRMPFASWLERAGAVRASAANADALLAAGKKVLVYPGGDREVFRPFTHRDRIELGDRRGYVRLAITHGVLIIPVVTSGIQSASSASGWSRARAALSARATAACRRAARDAELSIRHLDWRARAVRAARVARSPARARADHFPRTGVAAANDEDYVEACHEHVRTTMQVALEALADERRAERRAAIYGVVDRVLPRASSGERLSLAPRTPVVIAVASA